MPKTVVEITLDGNSFQINEQKKALQKIVSLPAADRNRLLEIANNPKALKGLEENWSFLSSMIGK